jgi:UDP-GlcNAc3NAcA epimerase
LRIVTVAGARPQFIKAAVVSYVIRNQPGVAELLLHTGQHYDDNMSAVFFRELEIPEPAYNLGIGAGTHGQQTGRMLAEIEAVLLAERPDWVLLYGDTNSTLAGALAAAKLHIPVAHVEAGLRSFNRRMPEEINRVVTDHVSDLLFAPTETGRANLLNEGVSGSKIKLVGDVMYDAALFYGARAESVSTILERLALQPHAYILATVHRPENTDNPARLAALFQGLSAVAATRRVVLPLHPRTRLALERAGVPAAYLANLDIIDPVGYLDMLLLEKNACLIASDSGGMQKEAYFYRVPCVTLRDETEWVELVASGWNRVCPPISADAVVSAVEDALHAQPGATGDFYGDGRAGQHIVNALLTTGRT